MRTKKLVREVTGRFEAALGAISKLDGVPVDRKLEMAEEAAETALTYLDVCLHTDAQVSRETPQFTAISRGVRK